MWATTTIPGLNSGPRPNTGYISNLLSILYTRPLARGERHTGSETWASPALCQDKVEAEPLTLHNIQQLDHTLLNCVMCKWRRKPCHSGIFPWRGVTNVRLFEFALELFEQKARPAKKVEILSPAVGRSRPSKDLSGFVSLLFSQVLHRLELKSQAKVSSCLVPMILLHKSF